MVLLAGAADNVLTQNALTHGDAGTELREALDNALEAFVVKHVFNTRV